MSFFSQAFHNLSLKLRSLKPFLVMALQILAALFVAVIAPIFLYLVWRITEGRLKRKKVIGFFHPYTNDGGGGERVLWCAVRAFQNEAPHLTCAVYTGDHDSSPQQLQDRALQRFGVQLRYPPQVVHLYKRKWIEATTYPHFTLIGQSLGSVFLAWEALNQLTPVLFFDSSGYAFTYPLARMFGCKVACYTHYPTINSDMLTRVLTHSSMYNNSAAISNSVWLSRAKALYYMSMTYMYGWVGSYANLSMVNSSWTQSHIEKLWKIPERIRKVYPPCNTVSLQVLPLERGVIARNFISVAQFRPEKAHGIQIEAFAKAIKRVLVMELNNRSAPFLHKLQFVGSCRNKEDEERLCKLKTKCSELGIAQHVEFHENVKYSELVDLLGGAISGLHSMIDEHFGICVVEYMAAGAVPIAHNSAGPRMDIVVDEDGRKTGFLATSADEFSDAIFTLMTMPEEERIKIAASARKRASRFSEEKFDHDFKVAIHPLLEKL